MPIIESIQVASVAVPLDKVTSFSTRTVSERHYCLVKVRGRDGNEGIGFCYVGSAGGDIAKVANGRCDHMQPGSERLPLRLQAEGGEGRRSRGWLRRVVAFAGHAQILAPKPPRCNRRDSSL